MISVIVNSTSGLKIAEIVGGTKPHVSGKALRNQAMFYGGQYRTLTRVSPRLTRVASAKKAMVGPSSA
ncbi:MAG: hypothetical protein LW865_14665 [Betaproteobacteria bacterium]|nr:hypothetical protein [Betaproteobacteria bacterium]